MTISPLGEYQLTQTPLDCHPLSSHPACQSTHQCLPSLHRGCGISGNHVRKEGLELSWLHNAVRLIAHAS